MGDKIFELKPGEWQFVDGYTAIWVHAPNTDAMMGLVRLPISPAGSAVPPVWQWDGNKEAPTLSPSIDVIGVWHGWLRAGKLETA